MNAYENEKWKEAAEASCAIRVTAEPNCQIGMLCSDYDV